MHSRNAHNQVSNAEYYVAIEWHSLKLAENEIGINTFVSSSSSVFGNKESDLCLGICMIKSS